MKFGPWCRASPIAVPDASLTPHQRPRCEGGIRRVPRQAQASREAALMGTGVAPKMGTSARALASRATIFVCTAEYERGGARSAIIPLGVERYARAAASALFRKSIDPGIAENQVPHGDGLPSADRVCQTCAAAPHAHATSAEDLDALSLARRCSAEPRM